MAKIQKITVGFVSQEWDTELKQWVNQEFIAGDEVSYEDADGNVIDEDSDDAIDVTKMPYLEFDMVQPSEIFGN
jgi:hypothetical protein